MHTISVQAFHQDGKVERIWDKSFDCLADAQARGVREAKEIILCDPEFHSVRAYQVVIPSSSGNYSRFFTLAHTIEEVLF